jgi:predicted metal-dependent phosphoesterase TrpH
MDDDETLPRLHRRSLLLGGAGLGMGVVTGSALLDFPAAAAGTRTTKTWHGRFSDPRTPDWHHLPFTMPKGARSIDVRYSFEPHDTGFGFSTNVVDIGVFDASGRGLGNAAGFRGWSGGARRHFRITRRWATPGYLAGPLTPGRWHVILGPFLIQAPGTPWSVTVTVEHGDPVEPAFTASHAPTSVAGTGPGWYRGDLHLHSVHSDGSWTLDDLLAQAKAQGLDLLGTSEHNTSSATRVWGHHVGDDFLVVSGEEVTTRNGHWLATGIKPGAWVDWRYRAADDQLGRFTDRTRRLGGAAIAAHPSVPVSGTRWDFDASYAGMDAVEVWNGPWSDFNQETVSAWHQLLVGGRFVPAVANSDSHHAGQTVGLAQTAYRLGTLSTAEVVAAVQGGHAWLAESAEIDVDLSATGATTTTTVGGPGDTVSLARGEELAAHLEVTGVTGTVAQLIGSSGVLAGAAADGSGHVALDATVPVSEAFVRAEVRRPGAAVDPTGDLTAYSMVALTNPVLAVDSGT